ncbi:MULTISPECIES: peptidoglycan bridge formation glycyltransferase FemA/FemB family protein [Aerococcus]|uniref:peptidoglycan bridge formation glycyltransferase FemA/FemB family protein n=1 Tax=Aerococcus TaxID=1375 RepID=UPI0007D96762|nr:MULTISPECIES: peptidoglycan bridge formation glycyltransferase FemA/FemB family protein [Aerococcus]KAA9220743.1 aminoacyltransferase [Aerococcus loyolae]KAA9265691.1 aminoacyltransferase [Aerococcus loyolae]MCY3026948.1 aminoacyltransferase [Aerococcus loyolae]MDK6231595.1 peptidoglycan bridge formation glycyltransferase FemA/FemB family protein [Aerococcus urinae]MDK6257593.1 peptidoglycan bridge formation glycyltransferase FemA/FemB family protein [Aerococcus urinae]
MIFKEISADQLEHFQQNQPDRHFFTQGADYQRLAESNQTTSKILAVVEGDRLLAYAIFIYYPYKKLFYKVTTQFGPIMDYANQDLVDFYFHHLKNYFKKNWRVLCVRVNPFLNERYFSDVDFIEDNPQADSVDKTLQTEGFIKTDHDLFDDPTLATRCVFSKDLTGLSKDNLLKNVSQIARYTINRTIKEGVQVRPLDIYDEGDGKILDAINQETSERIGFELRDSQYFRNLKNILKDDLILALAYIDCDYFLSQTKETIAKLKEERQGLEDKLALGKVNPKKTKNKIRELNENIGIWEKKIEKIQKLKAEEGNIVNLACASFIQSAEDFIYFSSGAFSKFTRFEGPYAILYRMLLEAIEKDFSYFNFYGTSSDFSEEGPDYGVLQFKRNFKGNIEWFMANYELRNALGKMVSW